MTSISSCTFNERQCRTCLNCLEDDFNFSLECYLYNELRKPYIVFTQFIELMTTQHKIEIRNLSVFIIKAFENRRTLYFE